jgi:Cdc6-like AAA superfamily ATPase
VGEGFVAFLKTLTKFFRRRRAGKRPSEVGRKAAPIIVVAQKTAPRPAQVRGSDPAPHGFPSFQSNAANQGESQFGDQFAKLRLKLRSAFTPSQPVADRRMFAGRTEAFASIITAIEDQRLHVIMYGDRGLGKTSLLRMLAQAATSARYLVVYSSCGAKSEFDDIFRAAASHIPIRYHDEFGPTSQEAERKGTFLDVFPEESVSPRQLTDIYSHLRGTHVLLILDEFDQCESATFRREVAEFIKALSDRSVPLQLVVTGVASDLNELVQHIPSIRRNIHPLRIPLMNDQEIRDLVTNGEQASGIRFGDEARNSIVDFAHGSPYVASLLGHHSGLKALSANRAEVLVKDVIGAVEAVLTEMSTRVSAPARANIRGLLSDGQIDAAATLASAALTAGGPFTCADGETRHGRRTDARAAEALADDLAARRILLDRRDDRGMVQYKFLEEGSAQYLWMLITLENFQPASEADVRSSTANA